MWSHSDECFENCTFMYEVTWQQSGDGSSLRNTTTTETSYTIKGLTPGTSYEIGVGAYCKNTFSALIFQTVTTQSEGMRGWGPTYTEIICFIKIFIFTFNCIYLLIEKTISFWVAFGVASSLLVLSGILFIMCTICIKFRITRYTKHLKNEGSKQ